MKGKSVFKNKGLLAGIFVSVFLLAFFVNFSGIPFTIGDNTYCGSTVTSISDTYYRLNDADWGKAWLVSVKTGLGCDVTTATVEGSQFVDGSFVGVEPVTISLNLKDQGCRGVIQQGTGGAFGGEYLRTLKRLSILDTAVVSEAFTINNAKIGAEKTCESVLSSQGNDYFISHHTNDCNLLIPFLPCTVTTECYGFQESDLNLLGTIDDNSRSVFYNIDMRLTGTKDSGTLNFNEGKSFVKFSTGQATVTDVGKGKELCPTFSKVVPVLTPSTYWFDSQWKLIDDNRVDHAQDLLVALPGKRISITGIDQTLNLIDEYNSAVESAINSTVALTLSNQVPLGFLRDEIQFDVYKSDVVRPQVDLKLIADWVGLQSYSGTPSIVSVRSLSGFTDRKIAVTAVVKNIGTHAGSFLVRNICSGAVGEVEQDRGLNSGALSSVVFNNSFGSVGTRTCYIEMEDLNGGGITEPFYYTINVTAECTLVDEGNWVVNQDTCKHQCGLSFCQPGFRLDSMTCTCVAKDISFDPQDCSLIEGSYWSIELNRCVCPAGEETTVGVAGALSCELVKPEVCDEGFKLNEAGDACIPKELNLLPVLAGVLIVGGIVFIGWNLWFGGNKGKGKGINFSRIVRG